MYRLARIKAGLTQAELARLAGVPAVYVIVIESQGAVKRRIARALGMRADDTDTEEAARAAE